MNKIELKDARAKFRPCSMHMLLPGMYLKKANCIKPVRIVLTEQCKRSIDIGNNPAKENRP